MSRRDDVLAALRTEATFLSAQELHARMRSAGSGIGLATVYRTLTTLESAGQVDTVRSAGGEVRYRWCGTAGHHHHLTCRRCGATVELDATVVERWVHELAIRNGFRGVEHVIELEGTCSACPDEADD